MESHDDIDSGEKSTQRAATELEGLLTAQHRRVELLEAQLRKERQKLSSLRAAKQNLLRAIQPHEPGQSDKNHPAKDKVLKILRTSPSRIWRVLEIQDRLEESGHSVSEKYSANTLRRLADAGLLVRVGRGRYRLADQTISIEGLSSNDYGE